jgi:uncharacterized membrane protein
MSPTFWRQVHGGSTHLPIVLLAASVIFDFAAWRTRDESLRRGLQTAGFGSALAGAAGAVGAVIAGLIMTRGLLLGGGREKIHHLFVWPAVVVCIAVVAWRLYCRGKITGRGARVYLAGMSTAAVLMLGAGYSGGEMLLAAEGGDDPPLLALEVPAIAGPRSFPPQSEGPNGPLIGESPLTAAGEQLFLKNCAHCHGADGHGDEGPDLHNLDWTDGQIAARIRNGKKGQMTAFAGKFSADDVQAVIAYLHTLK